MCTPMIIETAFMTVAAGDEAAFETALEKARHLVESSPGCRGMAVHRGIERPQTFMLVISWDSLADHTETFRGSEAFTQWRSILGPLFAETPQVEHWTAT